MFSEVVDLHISSSLKSHGLNVALLEAIRELLIRERMMLIRHMYGEGNSCVD